MTYACSEQMYQQQLCLHFADAQAARAVLLQTDPVEMKRIGDRFLKSNLEERTNWYNNHARKVMKNAVRLKFQQNPTLCELLKNHTGQYIEANCYDSIWWVGLSLKDDKLLYSHLFFFLFVYLFIWGFTSLSTLYRSYHDG